MEMRHDRLNGDKIMCASVISQGVCVFVVCMHICVFVQTIVTNNFFCLWPLRYVPYKYLKNVCSPFVGGFSSGLHFFVWLQPT